jgi:hypothetical protein
VQSISAVILYALAQTDLFTTSPLIASPGEENRGTRSKISGTRARGEHQCNECKDDLDKPYQEKAVSSSRQIAMRSRTPTFVITKYCGHRPLNYERKHSGMRLSRGALRRTVRHVLPPSCIFACTLLLRFVLALGHRARIVSPVVSWTVKLLNPLSSLHIDGIGCALAK